MSAAGAGAPQRAALRFDALTLMPQMFAPFTELGVARRAYAGGQMELQLWNPRDFAEGNYRRVDERPFGGGPGMVMLAEPLARCVEAAQSAPHCGAYRCRSLLVQREQFAYKVRRLRAPPGRLRAKDSSPRRGISRSLPSFPLSPPTVTRRRTRTSGSRDMPRLAPQRGARGQGTPPRPSRGAQGSEN